MIASVVRLCTKTSERSFALLLLVAACKRDADPPPPKPAPAPIPAPIAPAILDVTLGPPELLPGDGAPLIGKPTDQASSAFWNAAVSAVAPRKFPPGLSAAAIAGGPLPVRDKLVGWVYDAGTFIYDANANGDLRDDPKHTLDSELTLTLQIAGESAGSVVDVPMRLRKHADGAVYIQGATVRRGSIPLPKAAMQVAAAGDLGNFGIDYQLVAFDLDRDGALDLKTLDAPEQIRVFEQSVNLDGTTYAFSVAPDGSSLTLVPSAKHLPDRPRLTAGTKPPDVALTAFDGTKLKLSDLRGKVVLVDFWATSCPPCVKSLPRLAELRATYAPKGFELVAIAMPSDNLKTVLADHGAGIETADEAAQTAFRVDRFPTYFLLDKDGTIACSRCTLDAIESMIATKLGG